MVDRELVLRKLADLAQYVSQASEYTELRAEDYRRDWRTQRIVDRTLQLAIEVCADVASHLISDRGLRPPGTYADAFEVLREAGLLEPRLGDSLVRMARFRNLLVHDYARIDPEIVVRILRENLGDLADFGRAAATWIESS